MDALAQDAPIPSEAETFQKVLGRKIRAIRTRQGTTITQLAQAVGVSKSFLSQLEKGKTSASLMTIRNISRSLNIPLAALFNDVSDGEDASVIVRRGRRKHLKLPGLHPTYELLAPDLSRRMEPIYNVAEPGAVSSDTLRTHQGEEWFYVIRGQVELNLDGMTYVLEEGDAAYYDSTIPHRWRNVGDSRAEVIVVVTPPTF